MLMQEYYLSKFFHNIFSPLATQLQPKLLDKARTLIVDYKLPLLDPESDDTSETHGGVLEEGDKMEGKEVNSGRGSLLSLKILLSNYIC